MFLLASLPVFLSAQIGGRYVYESLRMPASARLTALGGSNVSLMTDELMSFTNNPALASEQVHSRVGFSGVSYLADIGYGTAGYAHHVEEVGTFSGALQYVGYGDFTRADEFGNVQGSFSANDMMLTLGAARAFGDFHFGMNVKALYSTLDAYNSFGVGIDFGGAYYNPNNDLGIGVSLRNIGTQLTTFDGADPQNLPFDVSVGVSKRVPHTPFRLSLTLHNLNHPELLGSDENDPQTDLSGNPIENDPTLGDQIFAHSIFGLEVLLSENFHIRAGYNHQRRAELKLEEEAFSFTGFSVGAALRIAKIRIEYSFARYFIQGGMHHIGISTAISDFIHVYDTGESPTGTTP